MTNTISSPVQTVSSPTLVFSGTIDVSKFPNNNDGITTLNITTNDILHR